MSNAIAHMNLTTLFLTAALVPVSQAADYVPLDAGDKVSVVDMEFEYGEQQRSVRLRLYLPATESAAPVILFSHGLGGSRNGSRYSVISGRATGMSASCFIQYTPRRTNQFAFQPDETGSCEIDPPPRPQTMSRGFSAREPSNAQSQDTKVRGSDDINVFDFVYLDGTSMASVKDPHMHQLTMTLSGKDKLTYEWVFFAGGEKQFIVRLDLQRKK